MGYKVVFDNGKPYEEYFKTETDLKKALKKFYDDNNNSTIFNNFDCQVFNDDDEDITDSQFINEIVGEII